MTTYSPRNLKHLPLHFGLFFVPFILVLRQPDIGTALVYGAFWLAMMIAGGLPVFVVILVTVVGTILAPWVWQALAPYQKSRIVTFLQPNLDPRGAGYNALQSTIAVGSGQFFGRGLGLGTQSHLRFLPEFHTDFIFATLVEELGFVGGFLLLAGYTLLLWRIISPMITNEIQQDSFSFTYAFGLFSMILAQIFINTGMNMGLMPITGITLPFISYGGSSILSLSISFGILWAIMRARKLDNDVAISHSS